MRVLLDTHIALWAIILDPRLSAKARNIIANEENEIFVSMVTLWEIAIKHGLNRGAKTDMLFSSAEALTYFRGAGYRLLEILPAHTVAVENLPRHHRDPFDRMLIAQAVTEPLHLLTQDPQIARYGGLIIEA